MFISSVFSEIETRNQVKMTQCDFQQYFTIVYHSADERLRGIGKQQAPITKPVEPPEAPPPREVPLPPREEPPPEMAERRIQQRQGRRDNFRGDQQELMEIKRRSRSEGPSRRVRQRDDKRVHQTDSFAKGDNVTRPTWAVEGTSIATRVSRHSPPASDDNGFLRDPGSDSDSYDSDQKVWKKNPLVTRKARRSGAYNDRRRSNLDNSGGGGHISTRDSFVYYSTSGQPHSDSSTGSFKTSNKYQKLEELRNKRIDIQMTSDEENTPESRISRLRQRAIQGGLGRQPLSENKPSNTPGAFPTDNHTQPPKNFQTRTSDLYSNVSYNNPPSQPYTHHSSPYKHSSNLPKNSQGNYVPQSTSYQQNVPQSTSYQQNVPPKQYQPQIRSANNNHVKNTPQNSDPVPFGSPQTARVMTYGRMINNDPPVVQSYTGVLSDSGPSTKTSQHQSSLAFNKNTRTTSVDNAHYSPVKSNRFVYNSSPEVSRKFDLNAARGSSIDSVYDTGVAQPDQHTARANILRRMNQHSQKNSGFQTGITSVENGHKPVYVNPPVDQTMEVQRGSVVKYPNQSFNQSKRGGPRVNEPIELRFDANTRQPNRPFSPPSDRDYRNYYRAHSEDSLDEIVLSNVQYLESQPGKGKSVRGEVPVSKSASLPDPKRYGGQIHSRGSGEVIVPYPSNQVQTNVIQAVPYRQKVEKSELEIRVPVSGSNRLPPEIKIAEENRIDPMDYNGNISFSAGFAVPRQERKLSYDSHTGHSRPTSQYYDRDDMSKSDTQLHTATIIPQNYKGDFLHPLSHYSQPKSVSADHLLPPGAMAAVHESGMFSDVDYDIEVSDRIRKWETFMKKSNEPPSKGNGNGLTTIQERTEMGEFGLAPYDLRRAQPQDVPRPIAVTSSYSWSHVENPRTVSSSEPTVHLVGDPRLFTHETNTHRLFQLVPGARIHTTSTSMSTLYHPQPITKEHQEVEQRSMPSLHYPVSQKPISAGQLREKIIIDRQSSLEDSSQDSPIQTDKGSKYMRYQELHDMQGSKDESVKNLCRLFNFNEDSEGRQVAKVSPHKQNDEEWTKIISDMEDNIKKTDVWSPHMESTKGESLSIERVKARTLQTIPFSDDPFWKEIEEMTSFESLVGQKSGDSKRSSFDDNYIGRLPSEGTQSQNGTLPSQPRLTTSSRDRLQRSKSLYTPNIAPLTLGMPPRNHNSQNTIEDALEELKTSVDRSSTRESIDSRSSSQTQSSADLKPSAPIRSSMYIENVPTKEQPRKLSWSHHRGSGVYDLPQDISAKDLYTFSSEPGQTFVNVVNGNYALDPNLLKSKLLNTGLVEDTEDPFYDDRQPQHRDSARYQETVSVTSKPVAMAAPQRHHQSEDKRNQVSESMEDLRQLAKNVETKIELIKNKLVQADDTNLDKILLALRKFAPSTGPKSPEIRSDSMHDFYHTKHSKLSDALSELERIYKNLDLENDTLFDRAERRDYPSYRKPSPLPESFPPLQRETASLSINIAPPTYDNKAPPTYDIKADVEKQTQSEFDAISKSFQAILDEVNQTSAVTTSSEDIWISGPQSTPDSPRLPMKVTLKSTQIPSPTSRSPITSVSTVTDSDQKRLRKSRQRFRSKVPDVVGDDVAVRKARSKSSPRLDGISVVSLSPTTADYLNPREMTAAKGRIRIRPEREPDVMHDDMAYRNLASKPQETAKSSIQIELSSPEMSPQCLPEKTFKLQFSGNNQPKVLSVQDQAASTSPTSTVKHEPKIMGSVSSNSSAQLKTHQIGKMSSLPTKIQPKEIVTATRKEMSQQKDEISLIANVPKEPTVVVEASQKKEAPVLKSVTTAKVTTNVVAKDSNTAAPSTSFIKQKTSTKDSEVTPKTVTSMVEMPNVQSTKMATEPNGSIEIQIPAKTEVVKTESKGKSVKPTTKTSPTATTSKKIVSSISNSDTAVTNKTSTAKVQPAKTQTSTTSTKTDPKILTKPVSAKTQPPKLDSNKLAKFNQAEKKQEKAEIEVKATKSSKLRVASKVPTLKIAAAPPKTVKTELKLSTGAKANSSETESSLKLPEKEIVIKLPATTSSVVTPAKTSAPEATTTTASQATAVAPAKTLDPAPASAPAPASVAPTAATTTAAQVTAAKTAETNQQSELKTTSPEKRTVETQTQTTKQTSKSKSRQNVADRRLKNRKEGKRVTSRLELFSSSDEDRHRSLRPLLTRSAPDLSLLSLDDEEGEDIDADIIDDPTSKGTQAEITEDNTDLDESDAVFADDSQTLTGDLQTVDSPVTRVVNQDINCANAKLPPSGKPDSSVSENKDKDNKNRVNIVRSDIDGVVRRRRSVDRNGVDNTNQSERPKSFHELIESFETNKKRLGKLRSLRKCVSEENVVTETVVAKVYRSNSCSSEPDLSGSYNRVPTKEEIKCWRKYS